MIKKIFRAKGQLFIIKFLLSQLEILNNKNNLEFAKEVNYRFDDD